MGTSSTDQENNLIYQKMQSSDNGSESTDKFTESDRHILDFLDSMDAYLILMISLSSTLRQGWLELASARHSMGTTHVSSTLFDLKSHHASTLLEVESDDKDAELRRFKLCKWVSSEDPEKNSEEAKCKDDESSPNKPESPGVQHHEPQEGREESGESPVSVDNHTQKARSRSISMFGTLVSPKLRATQLSFETALEMVVEICNVRASLLHAHEQAERDLKAAK